MLEDDWLTHSDNSMSYWLDWRCTSNVVRSCKIHNN